MVAEALVTTLRSVLMVLEGLGVPLAMMGGMSLAAWDRVRSTHDIDLLIGLTDIRLHTLLARLGAEGFRAKGKQAVIRLENAEFVQLLYAPPQALIPIQVDLLLADTEFQRQALARRVQAWFDLLERDVAVLTCEDLIVMKLEAGRIIDLVDAAALLRFNRGKIDMPYIAKWVKEFGVERRFAQASEEAARMDAMHE